MNQISKNYIQGTWSESRTGQTYDLFNPADLTKTTGRYPKSSVEDTQDAINAAGDAFRKWAKLSVYERADYLKKANQLMRERIDEIAEVITLENGKTIHESRTEVLSAVSEMEFQIQQGLILDNSLRPSRIPGVLAYQTLCPIGPIAVIAPWNFPFNVPARKITPALMAGDTCVLKPAQLTSGTGAKFVEIFHDAGLPAGVLNMVTGSGRVIGDELVSNEKIKAVTFTGSTEVGLSINAKAALTMKRTQLEMGGKNPMVVMEDADITAAAKAASIAAFSCAGQWCISTSRVLVHKQIMAEFVEKLLEFTSKIKVGNGMDPKSTIGPVCGQSQLDGILAGIEKGQAEGARLIYGGSRLMTDGLENGCFIQPTVFANVSPEMYIAQEEIFGPVLGIIEIENFEEALEIANSVKYGLGSSIFTKNLADAMKFVEGSDVGLTHVNMHTAYKEPQFSFGGVKESGFGIPEAGRTGLEFFTENKTIYIKAEA